MKKRTLVIIYFNDAELELSQDTPTLDDHSMYSCSGSIHSEPEDDREILDMENLVIDELPLEEEEEEEHMIVGPVCERLLEKGEKDEIVNIEQKVPFVPLPVTLESEVKIHKASDQLGINLEIVNDGLNGMVVTEIIPNGALAKDGRVSVGDFVTTINNESLRHVTQAQAKSILNRVQLLTSDISLRYIATKTAAEYIRTCPPQQTKYTIQPSPRSPFIEPEPTTGAAEIRTKSRSPIYSPLGCESASDRESEYVDCDWIDDRMSGVCSPLTSKEIEGKPPETFFSSSRKLSASSCEIEYISQVISGDELSEPKKPKPAESYSNKAIVLTIDKNSLSISDDTLDFVKELDNVQRPSVNTSIFSRERSLESLHSCKVHVQSVRELSKGLSEPILNSDKKKSEHFRTRRELSRKGTMTVTKTSSAILLANHWGPQRAVHIDREPKSSLGISIVGGKVDLYNSGPDSSSAISGIFIKNVLPNSPAGRTGELKTGDRILEVDGIDLRHASHERAVEVIRASGNPVKFLVQSLVQWGADDSASESSSTKDLDEKLKALSYSEICQGDTSTSEINISNEETLNDVVDIKVSTESEPPVKDTIDISTSSPPKSVSQVPEIVVPKTDHVSSTESEESEDDEYQDMEGKIRTAAGMEISRASAGNVKRSKEESSKDPEKEDIFGYTTNKVKKKYGNLGAAVVMVELEKGSGGLGISLAGHKDRTRMAVLICGLNPSGLAYNSGALQVGDEILEVNGVILHGRCHLNASAIIKGLPGPLFKIIALRKAGAVDDLSVKPITQFPVTLKEETPEQRYSSFKGLRTISIKKQSGQGLGIMIIEGKHAEVGQGIFISDIQEGSAAHQAGLSVGDMILAVNKDTLLGSNYDNAAALLKKTEGVVTLVVCNPNKAKEEERKVTELTMQSTASTSHQTPKSEKMGKPAQSGTPKLLPPPGSLSPSPSGKLKMDVDENLATTAIIAPGLETTIEINKDKIGLGISVVGGADTLLGEIIVHEIYAEGAAAKDGRLKPGDHILEVNSEDFRNIPQTRALTILRQIPGKVRMLVFRDVNHSDVEINNLDIMEIELTKKPGKGLGLSIVGRKTGSGLYISEIVPGGVASVDGRLMKGDQIMTVNGQDIQKMTHEEAAAVLKTATGKVSLKFGRYKSRRKECKLLRVGGC